MSNNESELSALIQECGTKMTNEDDERIVSKEYVPSYATNAMPMPGETLTSDIDNEQYKSIQELVVDAANEKLKQEQEEEENTFVSRSAFVENMLAYQQQLFFDKYKHYMDGKTKRRVRKEIERNFDKGKYNRKSTLND